MSVNLPSGIFDRDSCILSGPFNLLVTEVVNISESKYSFLEKFHSKEAQVSNRNKVVKYAQTDDEASHWYEKTSLRPTYKLTLEDHAGTRIYALTMDAMNVSILPPTTAIYNIIAPGSKVIISNVHCQRGVLLLNQGSVDDIQTMIISASTLRELEKNLRDRLEIELADDTS